MNNIFLIVATDMNNIIAKNGEIPWHCSSDFKFFKNKTIKNTVIMGVNTYNTIGKPLPDRNNIILDHTFNSNKHNICDDNANPYYIYNNIPDALNKAYELNKKIYICGGLSVYKTFLEMDIVYKSYINRIKKCVSYTDKDTVLRFPNIDEYGQWVLKNCKEYKDFISLELKNKKKELK